MANREVDSTRDPSVRIANLTTEDDSGLVACGLAEPRLSWQLVSDREGVMQRGYQVQIADCESFEVIRADSGFIATRKPFLASWPAGPLKSREVCWWKVRVRTDLGWTRWSKPSRIEASLLKQEDWLARPITLPSNQYRMGRGSVPYLRKEFELSQTCRKARLYVTALGVHDTCINGVPVGADLLEPGWTVYSQRLLFAAYDVTDLLVEGTNAITSAIGDGWWRGELAWMKRRAIYGDTTALIAQLEIETTDNSRTLIATDDTWRGTYGGLRQAELYDGCEVDTTSEPYGWREPGFVDREWEGVVTLDMPATLVARAMPGVQVVRCISPSCVRDESSLIKVDASQNLSGFLSFRADGPIGSRITVRHAELLNDEGRLHRAPLRNAQATDLFILNGREASFTPSFTFHGFRYAEIEFDDGVEIKDIQVDTSKNRLILV